MLWSCRLWVSTAVFKEVSASSVSVVDDCGGERGKALCAGRASGISANMVKGFEAVLYPEGTEISTRWDRIHAAIVIRIVDWNRCLGWRYDELRGWIDCNACGIRIR